MSYRNPILPGFNPDPSMIYHNGHYYLVTSSFEFFPGVPLYRSDNLIDWTLIGHVLSRRSQLDLRQCEPGGGIFAPCLRWNQFNQRFYVAVCALHRMKSAVPGDHGSQPRSFYVSTDDIEANNWSDPVYCDAMGIDQDLFFDDDGRTYLSVARPYPSLSQRFNLGSFCTEIDLATGSSLRPSVLIRTSDTEIPVAEGPHIFKRNGIYYLIVAEGGTEIIHQEWILRSATGPLGPWEVAPTRENDADGVNPLVFNGDDLEVRQTGHMDMCEGADGKWWAVFLAVRPQRALDGDFCESQLGRETFLCPVTWRDDGWPVVNNGSKVTINGDAAAGLKRLPANYTRNYHFAPDQDLRLDGWYSLRTPLRSEYSLSHREGSLTLLGGPQHFRFDEATTMLLIRQQSFEAKWELDLEFDPVHVDEEAGTAVWWSKWNFASLSIRGSGDRTVAEGRTLRKATGRELVMRRPDIGTVGHYPVSRLRVLRNEPLNRSWNGQETVTPLPSDGSSVRMRIVAEPTAYHFYVSTVETGTFQPIQTISSRVLTRIKSPVEWMFTGTCFGVYACGALDQPSFAPAVFSNISMAGVLAGGD